MKSKLIIQTLSALIIIAVLVISLLFSLWWGCPLLNLTGVPCPGCGMSRAFLAFFRLDLAQAFHYHPMFPALLMFPALFLIYIIRQARTYKRQGFSLGWAVLQNASGKLFSSRIFSVLFILFLSAYLSVYIMRVILPLLGYGDPSILNLLRSG